MKLKVLRYSSQNESTHGLLFDVTNKPEFLCYTLEDPYQQSKVYGNTRIPEGFYPIKLRTFGRFHEKYSIRHRDIHKGMLWIQKIANFEYVLIHTGNTTAHTQGCLLVGDTQTNNVTGAGFVGLSTKAYRRVYPGIAAALVRGEDVSIEYVDYDGVNDA